MPIASLHYKGKTYKKGSKVKGGYIVGLLGSGLVVIGKTKRSRSGVIKSIERVATKE